MIYMFTYYDNKNRLVRQTFDNDKAASTYFNLLVAAGFRFRIITTTKRGNHYGKL